MIGKFSIFTGVGIVVFELLTAFEFAAAKLFGSAYPAANETPKKEKEEGKVNATPAKKKTPKSNKKAAKPSAEARRSIRISSQDQ
jgi:hypothetical protein